MCSNRRLVLTIKAGSYGMKETVVYPSGLMLPSKMPRTSVRFLHRAEKTGVVLV